MWVTTTLKMEAACSSPFSANMALMMEAACFLESFAYPQDYMHIVTDHKTTNLTFVMRTRNLTTRRSINKIPPAKEILKQLIPAHRLTNSLFLFISPIKFCMHFTCLSHVLHILPPSQPWPGNHKVRSVGLITTRWEWSCSTEQCNWRDALRETLPLQQQDMRGKQMTSAEQRTSIRRN
jgi:hypothetical protein